MKTFLIMTIVVVLGVVVTTTVSLARLGMPLSLKPLTLDLPAEVDDSASSAPTASEGSAEKSAQPVAVVEQEEFDFGHLRNKTMDNRHTFKIRNEGTAPLEFTGSSVSCSKCTFVDLPDQSIAPGETGEVVVRWNVDVIEDHFRQSATVKTNDPEHEALRFVISGKVVRPLQAEPQKLVLSNVQVGKTAEAKLRLAAYFSDDFKVLSHTLSDAATADYFDVSVTDLPKDQLPDGAKSGAELAVKVKPGLPVGSFTQTLQIKTNLEDEPETTIPINGEVVGAVTIFGKGWERDVNYLSIGQVKQSQGEKRPVTLLVRGIDLSGLKLEPAQVDDDVLKVTYGEPVEMKEGTVVKVPVTIEIPPGSRLVNHMGGTAKLAQIIITTNKPALGRVKLSVKFAVIAD